MLLNTVLTVRAGQAKFPQEYGLGALYRQGYKPIKREGGSHRVYPLGSKRSIQAEHYNQPTALHNKIRSSKSLVRQSGFLRQQALSKANNFLVSIGKEPIGIGRLRIFRSNTYTLNCYLKPVVCGYKPIFSCQVVQVVVVRPIGMGKNGLL